MKRVYLRGTLEAVDNAQLAAQIDAATVRVGTVVTADRAYVIVDHPDLAQRDDELVDAVLRSYVFDPSYNTPPPPAELAAARDAVDHDDLKTAVRRLGDYAIRLARGA